MKSYWLYFQLINDYIYAQKFYVFLTLHPSTKNTKWKVLQICLSAVNIIALIEVNGKLLEVMLLPYLIQKHLDMSKKGRIIFCAMEVMQKMTIFVKYINQTFRKSTWSSAQRRRCVACISKLSLKVSQLTNYAAVQFARLISQ